MLMLRVPCVSSRAPRRTAFLFDIKEKHWTTATARSADEHSGDWFVFTLDGRTYAVSRNNLEVRDGNCGLRALSLLGFLPATARVKMDLWVELPQTCRDELATFMATKEDKYTRLACTYGDHTGPFAAYLAQVRLPGSLFSLVELTAALELLDLPLVSVFMRTPNGDVFEVATLPLA